MTRQDIRGVWKRVLLVDESGTEDRASPVYWVQGRQLCGDIRQHLRATLLVEGALPFVDAFAGELIDVSGAFRWEPAIRLRHRDGPPDEGRLTWIGENLREDGIHLTYVEEWTRIAVATEGDYAVALQDPEDRLCAYVLRIGSFVFYASAPLDDDSQATGNRREFSLFRTRPDGPQVVLSSCDPRQAVCPNVEFADDSRRTAWLSRTCGDDGLTPKLWHVSAFDDCGATAPGPMLFSDGDKTR